MGIGRITREEELEERHQKYITDLEDSELPDWIHEMYEQPYVDHTHRYHQRRLKRLRIIGWTILTTALGCVILAATLAIKSC